MESVKIRTRLLLLSLFILPGVMVAAPIGNVPPGADSNNPFLKLGYLDVTKPPYLADASGKNDSTEAIQKAVNDARDFQYVCFFPEGVYLVSDTISCEQTLYKLEEQKSYDGKKQNYWNDRNRPCILIGSRKGKRPLIKINPATKKFQDEKNPQPLIWVWAQTRDNAPGKDEPEWGKEQPNISFNQIFRGIDLDVSGFPGAAGIKHTGSQGSTLEDVKINAEGAFAGMINCPGQGGGTYNIEVIGGDYGLWADKAARFPSLVGLVCRGQKKAFVYHAGLVTPLLIAGFNFEGSPECAVSLVDNRGGIGTTLVDGMISFTKPGRLFSVSQDENLVVKNVFFHNVQTVVSDEKVPSSENWLHVKCYARCKQKNNLWVNEILDKKSLFVQTAVSEAPDWNQIKKKHVWDESVPSFEDSDVVNIKNLGAVGDGETDDTKVFKTALENYSKIFVPRGVYIISDTLMLQKDTRLFGAARIISDIRAKDGWGKVNTPIISTVDDKDAVTYLADMSITAPDTSEWLSTLHWKAGRHSIVRNIYGDLIGYTSDDLGGKQLYSFFITGSGGGRWYAVNCREGGCTRLSGNPDYRKFMVKGTTEPLAFYALNTERIKADYQSEIQDSKNVSIYYYKSEAAAHDKHGTWTPVIKISGSDHVSIYNISGGVNLFDQKSIVTIEDSANVEVTCAKSLRPSLEYNIISLNHKPIFPGKGVECAYFFTGQDDKVSLTNE